MRPRKPVPLPRLRKLAHSPISISSTDTDRFEEKEVIKKRSSFFKPNITEDYYKPVRIGNLYIDDYIGYKSSIDKNKTVSFKRYLEEIMPCLKDMINKVKKSYT